MRVLITGASGQLGSYLLQHYVQHGVPSVAWSGHRHGEQSGVELEPVDLTQREQIEHHFNDTKVDLIIHCAAISSLGEAYQKQASARAINTEATARLAELATGGHCRLVYISTDLVFDGEQGNYREEDTPRPLSFYGHTKLDAEAAVLDSLRGLVIRISPLFGKSLIGRPTFLEQQLHAMRQGHACRLFDDEWRTPLDLETAATAIATAAQSDAVGLLHLGGATKLSRLEMGLTIAKAAGLSAEAIEVVSRLSLDTAEPRPRDTSLNSDRFRRMFPQIRRPPLDESLARYLGVSQE